MTLRSPRVALVGLIVMTVGAFGLVLAADGTGSDQARAAGNPPTASASPSTPPVTPTSTPPAVTSSAKSGTASPLGSRLWLEVPALRLDRHMVPQGLVGGKINPQAGQVIWFTGSSRVKPGAIGTAVIAGHIVAGNVPDVFYHLDRLHIGSTVRVRDAVNREMTFRVVKTLVVDKKRLQTNQTVWGGNTSVRRLALVTCDDALGLRPDGHRVANYVVIAEAA
jgi:LPXTG-site transpeptidase (sortase) family protein